MQADNDQYVYAIEWRLLRGKKWRLAGGVWLSDYKVQLFRNAVRHFGASANLRVVRFKRDGIEEELTQEAVK